MLGWRKAVASYSNKLKVLEKTIIKIIYFKLKPINYTPSNYYFKKLINLILISFQQLLDLRRVPNVVVVNTSAD